jgi:hypothetical protein
MKKKLADVAVHKLIYLQSLKRAIAICHDFFGGAMAHPYFSGTLWQTNIAMENHHF